MQPISLPVHRYTYTYTTHTHIKISLTLAIICTVYIRQAVSQITLRYRDLHTVCALAVDRKVVKGGE